MRINNYFEFELVSVKYAVTVLFKVTLDANLNYCAQLLNQDRPTIT